MKPILAIDPGPTESAICLWDGERINQQFTMQCDNWDLADCLRRINQDWIVAVEMIASYGMAVGETTFETCVFIGRLQEIWEAKGRSKFIRIYRKEVKLHLCGNLRAKDANIRQALIDRFGEVGTKKHPGLLYGVSKHIWSALAVAVTCQETKL